MEISVKYLPIVFIFLVAISVIITIHDSLNGTKDLDNYSPSNNETSGVSQAVIVSLEKSVLRQVLNILWIVSSLIVYIKHRQVNDILNRYDMHNKKPLNRRTLQTGLAAAFGISIMANLENLVYVYWVGILLHLGFGAVYQCLQTVQYRNLVDIIGQGKTTILRMLLSIVSVTCSTLFFLCRVIAFIHSNSGTHLSWQNEGDRSIFYKTSIVLEWICAGTMALYLILYYQEFNKITLYEPDVFVEDKVTSSMNMQKTNEAFDDT